MSCFGQRRASSSEVKISEDPLELQVQVRRRRAALMPEDPRTVPIDSMTNVPVDLFERLLKEGQRARGQHRLVRSARERPRLLRNGQSSPCRQQDRMSPEALRRCRSEKSVPNHVGRIGDTQRKSDRSGKLPPRPEVLHRCRSDSLTNDVEVNLTRSSSSVAENFGWVSCMRPRSVSQPHADAKCKPLPPKRGQDASDNGPRHWSHFLTSWTEALTA